jgi:monoamine oxidase
MHSGKGYSIHTDTHNAAQHEIIVGGNQQLSTLMANEILKRPKNKVIVNAPCCKISQGKEGVIAYYLDRNNQLQKVRAKRAVVALPPPLASRIIYDPPLSPSRDVLYQRMKMGKKL